MERPCRCGSTGGTCGDLVQSSFSLDILTRDQDSLVCVAEGHAEVGRLTRSVYIIYYSWNGSIAEAVCAGEKRVRMR
jgi:hypothetical protein